ncbi:hypothetical protein, partial [Ignatzschineria cameli]|uniref:hypothetical protein n=1 Tax=Ignatzschineria cameli TaxID=2182793 RepID=UPI001956843F
MREESLHYCSDFFCLFGSEDANWRACICYKNEIVGSRRSTSLLKNHSSTKQAECCRILPSRSSTNHTPAVGNHSIARIVLIFIKADELPVLTIAFFHQSRAGKYCYFSDIILGDESADWRACACYKNEIVGSRRSTDLLKN